MATGPINYGAMMADPFDGLGQYLQMGQQIQQIRAQRAQAENAQLAAQQYQADVGAAFAAPTPQAFAALAVKYPQHREAFKQGWDGLNAERQQSELGDVSTLAAALQSGRADLAMQKLDARIKTMGEAGADTSKFELLKGEIERDPKKAYGTALSVLAGIPGGDKVLENLGKIGTERRAEELQPTAMRTGAAAATKAEADAVKAGVDAKYAEQTAITDLEKKGWDIKKIKADIDISREANRIAAMNAAANREGNALKRQELGIRVQEARGALDEKIRAKAAEAETAAGTIDNMVNTIDRLKQNKGLRDVVGSIEGMDFYPTQGAAAVNLLNPFTSSGDDRADAIAMIKTLGSQAFLAMVPQLKGSGNLSDAEGKKLETGLQSLSRQQSEKQFVANLDEVQRLMLKARKGIEARTGVKLSTPDTPAANPNGSEIDALLKKYGG